MDPLSISASIAGLVTLADVVFRAATRYVKSVKGSCKEAEDLSREVKSLSVLMHNLSLVAFDLETQNAAEGASVEDASHLKPQHLHECQQLLRRLEKNLCETKSHLESKFKIERLQSRLKWPFSSAETKEILKEVQRHKQTIDLALAADTVSKLRLCLSRQVQITESIDNLQIVTNKILDIETKVFLDKKRTDILDVFTKVNPRPEFETNKKLRHALTGLWLTEGPDFNDWFTTPGSGIWCSGIPGAGKSVLAASIIDECLQRNAADPDTETAVAYFFCTYRDSATHLSSSILSSLCAQIALQHEGAFKILEEYHNELKSDRHLTAEPTTERLIKVLRQMCGSYSQVHLIIDGLDECGDHVEANVRSLVTLALSQTDERINLALLSRDEVPIREQLDTHFTNIEIEAHTEDLQLYVASELDQRISSKRLRLRDLNLKDQIMAKLISRAKGMFRWVACQLDYICELPTDRARREALDKLPPTLPATYERILLRIEGYNDEVRRLVRRTLMLLSSPLPERLNFKQICEAVSLVDDCETLFDDEILEEEEVLRWCGSLVRTSKDGLFIEFAHFTVQEYLQGDCLKHPTLSDYGVSRERACNLLASLCLHYLTLENHERLPEATESEIQNILERRRQRPFYEHAAIYWSRYLSNCQQADASFPEQIYTLFQSPKTPSFCSWAIELISHCLIHGLDFSFTERGGFGRSSRVPIEAMAAVLRPDFTPLHMAAALGIPNLCGYLLDEGATVNLASRFGTPFHGAIGGLTVFADADTFDLGWSTGELQPYATPLARRQTAYLLFQAGAKPGLRLMTPFKTATALSLPISLFCSSMYEHDLKIVVDLVRAGVVVEEGDLQHFQRLYRLVISSFSPKDFKKRFNNGQAFKDLLQALEGQGTPIALKSRLYAEAREFFRHMKLETLHQTLDWLPTDSYKDEDIYSFLYSLIEKDDALALDQFLASSRSELVKVVGIDPGLPDWTSLHLAVHLGSLNVLNALLRFGVDVRMASKDGKTPVHLCQWDKDEEALLALLKNGASTAIPDETQRTIWHYSAENNSTRILKVLLELDERELALQAESNSNETPICAALARGHKESVLLLVKYCNSNLCWKSTQSIFRPVIELECYDVIQVLLDAGVAVDRIDDYLGNPLHFLTPNCPIECIQKLKEIFSVDQRREQDHRTPLELMLKRSAEDGAVLSSEVLDALLPSTFTSTPREASILWSFACSETVGTSMNFSCAEAWLKIVFFRLIQLGIAKLYEEESGSSAIIPFVAAIANDVPKLYQMVETNKSLHSSVTSWKCIREIVLRLSQDTKHWTSARNEPNIVRLLSLSILDDDPKMISLLMANGINPHSRIDRLSPLEFACFPNVHITEPNFAFLLAHSTPNELTSKNESFGGCGALHFTGGYATRGEGSAMKLRQLLQMGIDCNLPVSDKYGPPLVHHIYEDALNTAELLLEFGANPWAVTEYPFDAPLEAIRRGHFSILAKIVEMSKKTHLTPRWDRTWKKYHFDKWLTGGNALHLAALYNRTDCLQLYLDHNLLLIPDITDNEFRTPVHYAAKDGYTASIEILAAHGANINATDHNGWTPLHLAVWFGQLGSVKTLVKLGAKQQACIRGCTPLAYAYTTTNAATNGSTNATTNSSIIEALQTPSEQFTRVEVPINSRKVVRALADGLQMAINQNDVNACQRVYDQGCPINTELNHAEFPPPLALAICTKRSHKVIRWLLDNGASVSAIFPQPYLKLYSTVVEFAVANSSFNPLLSELLTKHLEEGGDILGLNRSLLCAAIKEGNSEGLEILFNVLRDKPVPRNDLPHRDLLTACVLERAVMYPHETALHTAAYKDDLKAAILLVENGAKIDGVDIDNETPLHYAARCGSVEVIKYLLSKGARPDALNHWSQTPLVLACTQKCWVGVKFLMEYGASITRTDYLGRAVFSYLTQSEGNLYGSSLEIFHHFLDQGFDINQVDVLGASPAHWLMASESAVYLRSLLNRDARLLRAQQMPQWPSLLTRDADMRSSMPFLMPSLVGILDAIAKNLRLIRPFLSMDELRHVCGLTKPGNHSLLCWAACWGAVEPVQNLLAFGPDAIEHECHDHGTPLVAAFSNCRGEVVKCLVRNGARVTHDTLKPRDFKISVTNPGFEILQWLFVGRYLERRGILDGRVDDTETIGSWAGPCTAEVELRWNWRQSRSESMLEYATRRQEILLRLKGIVIKPLKWYLKGDRGVVHTMLQLEG